MTILLKNSTVVKEKAGRAVSTLTVAKAMNLSAVQKLLLFKKEMLQTSQVEHKVWEDLRVIILFLQLFVQHLDESFTYIESISATQLELYASKMIPDAW